MNKMEFVVNYREILDTRCPGLTLITFCSSQKSSELELGEFVTEVRAWRQRHKTHFCQLEDA